VTPDEFKQIRSYLLEISTHGVSFQITDRPDAKIPKVNWPGKPDLQALFSGDPGDRVAKALGGDPGRVAGQTRVLRTPSNGELERFSALRLECTVRNLEGFEDAALLHLSGLVDPESMVAFESHIARVRHRGFNRVVLDFENVRYVSAMGLSTLARLVEPSGHPSTAAIAVGMPPRIASVTSMLRLQERMTILDGVDDAVAALTTA
jgi:anti-anti-sigma factor